MTYEALFRDMERVKALAMCACCYKKSDGAAKISLMGGLHTYLCGTDYDLWLTSTERKHYKHRPINALLAEFINRIQAERRNKCT